MKRKSKLAAALCVVAGTASLFNATTGWAAKPGSGGGIFATSCDTISYGYPREAIAINAPSGTTMVAFTFWADRTVYDAYMADPLNYQLPPGYAQGGTDFNGRDGWWMYSTYPSQVVVAEALNRKGAVLARAMDYCIFP